MQLLVKEKNEFCLLPLELHLQLICTGKVIPKETKHTLKSIANRGSWDCLANWKQFKNSANHHSLLQQSLSQLPKSTWSNQLGINPPSQHKVGHVRLLEEPAVMWMHFLSDEDMQLLAVKGKLSASSDTHNDSSSSSSLLCFSLLLHLLTSTSLLVHVAQCSNTGWGFRPCGNFS